MVGSVCCDDHKSSHKIGQSLQLNSQATNLNITVGNDSDGWWLLVTSRWPGRPLTQHTECLWIYAWTPISLMLDRYDRGTYGRRCKIIKLLYNSYIFPRQTIIHCPCVYFLYRDDNNKTTQKDKTKIDTLLWI